MATAVEFDLLTFLRKNLFLTAPQLEILEQDKSRDLDPSALIEHLAELGYITSYQREQILQGDAHKLLIGAYRLIEPLGEGGMGMVFRAWQPRLERMVAIKLIRPQVLAAKPEVLTRFHREAKAIAQLNHPNIVTLYDADELEGVHFIAMEYVDGLTLEKMVRSNGPLSIKQACEYIRQCALGLQHAAECGLVHRDIKPSNILVTQKNNASAKRSSANLRRPTLVTMRDRDLNFRRSTTDSSSNNWGTIKILDMGLARLNETIEDKTGHTPLTRAGALLGTPDFISPEQARDASSVDIRSDLYSLGCTFYYILTGRPPFPGGTDVQKILRHQTDTPVPLEEMRPNIPMPVVTITRRLLMKRPDDRFSSPKQLSDLLDQYLNGKDNSLSVKITPQEDAPPKVEDVATLGGVSDSQLLDSLDSEMNSGTPIPAADIYMETEGHENTTEMATQSEMKSLHSSTLSMISAHTGLVTSLSMARNGRLCVSGGLDGTVRVWDISKPTPVELAMLPRPGVEIQAVALAPDEPYIVVGGTLNNQARLWRWDYQEEKVYDWGTFDDKHGVNCINFSPDGRMLVFSIGHVIYAQKISNRTYSGRSTLKGHNNQIRSLSVSPDRRLIASGSEGRNIRIWSNGWLGSSSKAKLEGHSDIVTAVAFSPNSKLLASAGLDRAVILWDALTPSLNTATILNGHSNNIRLVQFLPGNQHLLSVGEAGEVFLWNLRTFEKTAECKTGQILSCVMTVSESGRRLAAGTSDGRIQLYELSLPIYHENPKTMYANGDMATPAAS
ncbi:serine/threonine protein kinase [Telmatocola sphagniphila]|uniref:Serine/threonine protein kinase n=1 Tax=Telmatocola sphagniphila TaxID=1123043 RepID=A0A8E6EVC4_9BACT|nr:serine/threonine-protein kinase [Telmatocola sphagniphila]QVL32545.1 serine/threonine protein kinase [Telmatocola sphagniphila]